MTKPRKTAKAKRQPKKSKPTPDPDLTQVLTRLGSTVEDILSGISGLHSKAHTSQYSYGVKEGLRQAAAIAASRAEALRAESRELASGNTNSADLIEAGIKREKARTADHIATKIKQLRDPLTEPHRAASVKPSR